MAQRVSVNLEAPSSRRLQALANGKDYAHELLAPLARADEMRRQIDPRVSLTTQFVVGAADESDQELLSASSWLYEHLRLARTYYSAFQPITNTPLEDHPPAPAWREHRLYQADFLLRQYGFATHEMVFDGEGNLPRSADPKLAWARRHPERFPVEVNTAGRDDLLRIPGIGPVSADRIMTRRRQGALHDLQHMGIARASAQRAAPFILLNGRQPSFQMALLDDA
jgi:predicted DNA-binding helix-hairpin-helix protein